MHRTGSIPVVGIMGKKNSGKTTLLVAVAAELKRRGVRVATMKHGHHEMEIDQPGRDSWRHFNEGGAEATLLVSGSRVAAVMRWGEEPDPAELIEHFYAGRPYDVVLVEGYKHGPFAKVEIFREAVHSAPVHDIAADNPLLLAVVSDRPALSAACPVIPIGEASAEGQPSHVAAVADIVERYIDQHPARQAAHG
jgi:molybdopterin-guanine dinucleotide biosynthesis protein MobB